MEHEEALPRAGGEQPLFVQRVNDSVDSEVDWGIQMFYQDDEGVSDVVHQNGKKNAYYIHSVAINDLTAYLHRTYNLNILL